MRHAYIYKNKNATWKIFIKNVLVSQISINVIKWSVCI